MSAAGVPDEIAAMREHVQGAQRECLEIDRRALLRDAVCVRALLDASDCRAVGDDATRLLAESIAVIAANMWHACWNSFADRFPPAVMHAAGQLGALARSRLNVLEEAMSAPEDRHSFLVEQVGWLDTLAGEIATRLIEFLRAIEAAADVGDAA